MGKESSSSDKQSDTLLTATEISETSSDVLSEAAGEPLQSRKEIDFMRFIVVGVAITMFVGFAAAFIAVGGVVSDWLAQKHATTQSLRDQINTQNDKIEELTEQLQELTKAQQDVQKTIQKTN